jgi:S-adenosylmethionine decarboxylase proenzyme
MKDACEECGATVLSSNSRGFGEGSGFTYAIILAESHATCHTWPEYGLATFDIFTCGTVDTKSIMKQFLRKLEANGIILKRYEEQLINRGFIYNEYDANQLNLNIA